MAKRTLQALTIASLADGFAGRAIDSGLKRVFEDIDDRGDDGKSRTLTVKLTFTPGGGGTVSIDVDTAVKLPSYRPQKTLAKLDHRTGGLAFSPDASENPEQMALPGLSQDDAE